MAETGAQIAESATAAIADPEVLPKLSHPKTIEKAVDLVLAEDLRGKRVLDLGAGHGSFCSAFESRVGEHGLRPGNVLTACDLYAQEIRTETVPRVGADFDRGLPFADATFDVVVCVEVIEHVRNQPALMAEIYRVLKPGGRAIVSTPNILNANGRLRYLVTGTWPLFDIMPWRDTSVVSVSGHIAPISLYYLYYFAKIAGFGRCAWHIDRAKRSARLIAPAIWLLNRLYAPVYGRRRRREPWYDQNRDIMPVMNSWKTLVARTIILEAWRPGAGD